MSEKNHKTKQKWRKIIKPTFKESHKTENKWQEQEQSIISVIINKLGKN